MHVYNHIYKYYVYLFVVFFVLVLFCTCAMKRCRHYVYANALSISSGIFEDIRLVMLFIRTTSPT